MKKFFKNPDEAKKSDAKSVTKILKKVFSKGVEGSKFFYKAEFEYESETAPFVYIGAPAGPWKQFIKNSKKDKDFVAGLCKVEEADGKTKLLLQAQMGKGSKALFLKAVNKQLLKKISAVAEFVDTLEVTVVEEEAVEEEEAVAEVGAAKMTPEEMVGEIKEVSNIFKTVRAEHDADQIDALLDKISDWEDNYEAMSPDQQQKLAPALDKAQKLAATLQKINQVDSAIDGLMDKIYPLLENYIEMGDHTTTEALALKSDVEKKIAKVEGLAQKISDNDFMEACKQFRKVLAS